MFLSVSDKSAHGYIAANTLVSSFISKHQIWQNTCIYQLITPIYYLMLNFKWLFKHFPLFVGGCSSVWFIRSFIAALHILTSLVSGYYSKNITSTNQPNLRFLAMHDLCHISLEKISQLKAIFIHDLYASNSVIKKQVSCNMTWLYFFVLNLSSYTTVNLPHLTINNSVWKFLG